MPNVIAQSGERWLVDIGNDQGRVYDEDARTVYPPRSIASILKQGYWDAADTIPGEVLTKINALLRADALNAPQPDA